jgi:hypothetical protein
MCGADTPPRSPLGGSWVATCRVNLTTMTLLDRQLLVAALAGLLEGVEDREGGVPAMGLRLLNASFVPAWPILLPTAAHEPEALSRQWQL